VEGELPEVLKPEHGVHQANITIQTLFLENVKTRRITPHRAGVERITESGMVLSNGTTLEIDMIICCTGYVIEFPYLPEESYHSQNNPILNSPNSIDLYKLIVSPQYPNLFFIGTVELPGPLVPASEIQARWATAILTNRIKLPSPGNMREWIKKYQQGLTKTVSSVIL
jgi:dimethylaniline monooxygenase (N-oxide forming)